MVLIAKCICPTGLSSSFVAKYAGRCISIEPNLSLIYLASRFIDILLRGGIGVRWRSNVRVRRCFLIIGWMNWPEDLLKGRSAGSCWPFRDVACIPRALAENMNYSKKLWHPLLICFSRVRRRF